MPLYEYHCLDCHQRFDRLRATADRDVPPVCPRCAGQRAKRTLSVFATVRADARDSVNAAAPVTGGCACGGHCNCH